jgi:hypothetical protein
MTARPIAALLIVGAMCACTKPEPVKDNQYPMTATIVARDPSQNALTMDNKDIPGVMEAMRMDYTVRGAKVDALPANGTAVTATLHESDGNYWVTDVKPLK